MSDADRFLRDLMAEVAHAAPPPPPMPTAPSAHPGHRRRSPALVVAASFLAVVALAAVFYVVAGTGAPSTPVGGAGETISFTTDDGVVLRGRLWSGSDTAVLMAGAYGAEPLELLPVLEPLADRGLTVMTYDLRGQGRSGGGVDVPAAVTDLAAAVEYLQSTGISDVHVVGYRHSGTAAMVLASRDAAGLDSVTLLFPMDRYIELDGIAVVGQVDVPLLLVGASPDLARAAPPQRETFGLVGQPADFNVRGDEIAAGIAEFIAGLDG